MLEIAIDVGGTFTDVVCLHDQQRLLPVKVPTTPNDLVLELTAQAPKESTLALPIE